MNRPGSTRVVGVSTQLAQIALCSTDLPRSVQLYTEAFGFAEAGGRVLWGPRVAQIQGLGDDTAFTLWWLVGRQDLVQLEFFHHTTPPAAGGGRPGAERPRLVALRDHRARLRARPRAARGPRRHPAVGAARARAACGGPASATRTPARSSRCSRREPPPREESGRGSTTSSPRSSMRRSSCPTWRGTALLPRHARLEEEPETELHPPELEALWGLAGARRESFVARGGDVYLEVVQYLEPQGQPLPDDHLLSDRGFMNVALGFREQDALAETYARVEAERLSRQLPDAEGRGRHVPERRPGQHRRASDRRPRARSQLRLRPPAALPPLTRLAAAVGRPGPSLTGGIRGTCLSRTARAGRRALRRRRRPAPRSHLRPAPGARA